MSDIKELESSQHFNNERCSKLYEELVQVFQKYQPTVGEILIAYGNLGYTLGASIGAKDSSSEGPSIEELKQIYYAEPGRLDIALMLNGLMITTWLEDIEKLEQKGK